VAVIEYASQAAAIHAALAGSGFGQGRPAYIGMVKSVLLHRARLSDIEGDIELTAECILSQDGGAVYRFEAYSDARIADGRLNLVKPG
jgi:predicted hotdog family 3-hydroxylacyl-ACP dehydratase